MKFKELKAMQPVDLKEKSLELRKELMKENAQVAIGTVPKNPRKIRNAKKAIAMIETILAGVSKTIPAKEAKPAKQAEEPKK
jgi:large subunit ribosomal protein L29